MNKIGITGGMGSGKTVVASLMEIMGVPVYIADEESKKLTDSSPTIRNGLIDLFGESLYTGNRLNRPLLASHIFSDPVKLAQVNAIIHPEVNRHFLAWAAQQEAPCCAIEAAILFEAGFDRSVDHTVMVYAPLELRIQRAIRRGGIPTREEALRRINSQLPDEIKKEKADYIIWNDDRQALIPQVETFLSSLQF